MNDHNAVRCRIAPSPTGVLHIGTARTALFNYLFAKKHGGKFFLRIEDTDKERSTKEFESEIISSLQWLGIHWDSEVTRQSERRELHSAYLKKLYNAGKIYYCFHTIEELSAEGHQAHVCEYRDLPKEKAEEMLKSQESTSVMRFKTPPDAFVVFHDLIRGEVKFHSKAIGDFSIAKNINEPLYNFAVVIDDADALITHVIRGEDHISNTPKQIFILGALRDVTGEEKFKQPAYAHLPLILGSDRSKLSKRHGATSVSEFREQGYLPGALINFMALLGWNPGDEREFFTLDELTREFTIEKVQKSGAVFNQERLDFVNGHYIRQTSVDELTKLCLEIPSAHTSEMKDDEYTRKIIALESPRLKKLSELPSRVGFFFHDPEYDPTLLIWKNSSSEATLSALESSLDILHSMDEALQKEKTEQAFLKEAEKSFKSKGELLWPLRVALSGQKASPGPFEIMEILGKKIVMERISAGIKKFSKA